MTHLEHRLGTEAHDGPHIALVRHGDLTDGDLLEMTYEERKALPAKHHQPYWMGLCKPAVWMCAVCWSDDGDTTGWPCEVAGRDGKAVAEAGGLRFAW